MSLLAPHAWPLLAAPPLLALLLVLVARRRAEHARRLGFAARRWPGASAWAAVAAALLVSVAALQPALLRSTSVAVRSDVQVWLAIDTSNSMLASAAAAAPSRLAQAERAAGALRARLGALPVGLAEMTSQVLPLLPPTADQDAFRAVLHETVKPNTPPPLLGYAFPGASQSVGTLGTVVTGFGSLAVTPQLDFYAGARRRVLVVLSDCESEPFSPAAVTRSFRTEQVALLLVKVGSARDRIWRDGRRDPTYRPLLRGQTQVRALAAASAGGRLFSVADPAAVAARVRQLVGSGPTSREPGARVYLLLSPYLLLAALPLLLAAAGASLGLARPPRRRLRGSTAS